MARPGSTFPNDLPERLRSADRSPLKGTGVLDKAAPPAKVNSQKLRNAKQGIPAHAPRDGGETACQRFGPGPAHFPERLGIVPRGGPKLTPLAAPEILPAI